MLCHGSPLLQALVWIVRVKALHSTHVTYLLLGESRDYNYTLWKLQNVSRAGTHWNTKICIEEDITWPVGAQGKCTYTCTHKQWSYGWRAVRTIMKRRGCPGEFKCTTDRRACIRSLQSWLCVANVPMGWESLVAGLLVVKLTFNTEWFRETSEV